MHSFGLTLARLTAIAVVRAGAVLAGCAVAAGAAGVAWGAQDVLITVARPEQGLTIEGSISGVRVGGPSADLVLTLRNPGDEPKRVTRVSAQTTGVLDGPAGCDRAYLSLGAWSGAADVPAHGSATVTLPVAVAASLPHECVDVTWGLAYTAH